MVPVSFLPSPARFAFGETGRRDLNSRPYRPPKESGATPQQTRTGACGSTIILRSCTMRLSASIRLKLTERVDISRPKADVGACSMSVVRRRVFTLAKVARRGASQRDKIISSKDLPCADRSWTAGSGIFLLRAIGGAVE
jgi:hypothetical protein